MSGGVDSSVAAKLLVDSGFKVAGVFLHFWKDSFDKTEENKCCSEEALRDVGLVCQKIGIRLYTMNFSKIFKKQVVDNFLHEYKIGNTPNPCVRCNRFVKLGLLIEKAKKLGFDYVASGHYAKVKKARKQESKKAKIEYKLLKAKDKNKDQSYFLYTLSQQQLEHLLFPLANYTKIQVRQMAKNFKLPVAEKRESQEVCFINKKTPEQFLKIHLKLKSGLIKTIDSKIIGQHQGLPLYTIGQRKGIKIGGSGPYYVVKKDFKTNTLFVVNNARHPLLFSNQLIATNINWLSGQKPKFPIKRHAVIRYGHKPAECTLKSINKHILVKFKVPQRAITPGQSIVFYNSNEVLGGGIIK